MLPLASLREPRAAPAPSAEIQSDNDLRLGLFSKLYLIVVSDNARLVIDERRFPRAFLSWVVPTMSIRAFNPSSRLGDILSWVFLLS